MGQTVRGGGICAALVVGINIAVVTTSAVAVQDRVAAEMGQAAEPAGDQAERARQILATTRRAMGWESRGQATSLVATGRARRVRGNNLVPIEFDISLQFPDKYVRRDESPAEESEPTTVGFNGADLVQVPPPEPVAGGGTTPAERAARRDERVTAVKREFARLFLGLFADSPAAYPLTFMYLAQAEAPQGRADVLHVSGPEGFVVRLFISSQTGLPIMASWSDPPTAVVVTVSGQPAPDSIASGAVVVPGPPMPAASASQEEKKAFASAVNALREAALAKPVEHRLYFGDYREVDGVRLPFRLRRAIGADTTEETVFDAYRINTRIDPRRFTPIE